MEVNQEILYQILENRGFKFKSFNPITMMNNNEQALINLVNIFNGNKFLSIEKIADILGIETDFDLKKDRNKILDNLTLCIGDIKSLIELLRQNADNKLQIGRGKHKNKNKRQVPVLELTEEEKEEEARRKEEEREEAARRKEEEREEAAFTKAEKRADDAFTKQRLREKLIKQEEEAELKRKKQEAAAEKQEEEKIKREEEEIKRTSEQMKRAEENKIAKERKSEKATYDLKMVGVFLVLEGLLFYGCNTYISSEIHEARKEGIQCVNKGLLPRCYADEGWFGATNSVRTKKDDTEQWLQAITAGKWAGMSVIANSVRESHQREHTTGETGMHIFGSIIEKITKIVITNRDLAALENINKQRKSLDNYKNLYKMIIITGQGVAMLAGVPIPLPLHELVDLYYSAEVNKYDARHTIALSKIKDALAENGVKLPTDEKSSDEFLKTYNEGIKTMAKDALKASKENVTSSTIPDAADVVRDAPQPPPSKGGNSHKTKKNGGKSRKTRKNK